MKADSQVDWSDCPEDFRAEHRGVRTYVCMVVFVLLLGALEVQGFGGFKKERNCFGNRARVFLSLMG